MIKVLFDQNFNQLIARGLLRRIPKLDCASTETLGIKKFRDDQILGFASENDRVVFTHDEKTFQNFAYEMIERGEQMNGLVIVPDSLAIGRAIDELEFLVLCRFDYEWENSILRLPI